MTEDLHRSRDDGAVTAPTWSTCAPDPAMLGALDAADAVIDRTASLAGTRAQRNNWSNAFADGCARMVAAEVRRHRQLSKLIVRPEEGGSAEPLTFVAGGRQKNVDVVVSSAISGLQVGFSLKGMNFRDAAGSQFDKNLTGRTYELQDEVAVIHRYQPASFLVALYFLPLASTVDKKSDRSPSSFARTVAHLRARTGRSDTSSLAQADRVDMAAVALYVPRDGEHVAEEEVDADVERGVVRYFDVLDDPPRRGRPRVATTLTLKELVARVADRAQPSEESIDWADPE